MPGLKAGQEQAEMHVTHRKVMLLHVTYNIVALKVQDKTVNLRTSSDSVARGDATREKQKNWNSLHTAHLKGSVMPSSIQIIRVPEKDLRCGNAAGSFPVVEGEAVVPCTKEHTYTSG